LPHLAYDLQRWLPVGAKPDGRYGVKFYHDSILREAIEETSPEFELLGYIDDRLFSLEENTTPWEGSASQLLSELRQSVGSHYQGTVLDRSVNTIGTHLGSLAESRPDRVRVLQRTKNQRRYRIFPPDATATDSD
jgi:hypothetical protein